MPADTNTYLSADQYNHYWYRLATTNTKKISFFISFKWYWPSGPIQKIAYQPIPKTHSVLVAPGYLLVGCKLVEYARITIKTFYLLESVRILPSL
jgi:hypothetical protein